MTVQQAQAEINKCEQEITCAHSSLCSAARTIGSSAKECADRSKARKILFPLIISLVGIFFFLFGSAWFLGLVLIIVGIVIACIMDQSASLVSSKVAAAQKMLNSTIDNNSII